MLFLVKVLMVVLNFLHISVDVWLKPALMVRTQDQPGGSISGTRILAVHLSEIAHTLATMITGIPRPAVLQEGHVEEY